MNKEYVQQYVKLEREHWWFVVRQKIILQFLKKYSTGQPLSILNIGAAGGASSQWLTDLGKVISVETDPFFIDHLKALGLEVVGSSVNNLPFADNCFDLVCAFDVIEHVIDDSMAIKEMERVCKTSGVVCVTVPAFQMLWSDHDVVNQHQRRYKKNSLLSAANGCSKLKILDVRYFNFLLFVPIFIAKKISGLFRKKDDRLRSDFESYKTPGFLNQVFKSIFTIEISLMKFMHFPFGVSLIAAWKKEVINK